MGPIWLRRTHLAPALWLAMVLGGGCRTGATAGAGSAPGAASSPGLSTRVRSNILRQDYAGSAACEGCHAAVFAAWRHSPMHEMTRLPAEAQIRARFAGERFSFKDDVATFAQQDGVRFVSLSSAQFGEHVYRVTKVIGGRYREDYAGVEVSAAQASAPVLPGHLDGHRAGAELILPVSYLFESQSFRLKGYSVMVGSRPGLRAGGVWNQTCVFCHNTSPYFDSLWAALYGPGAPTYQGEVVDRLLPASRRWTFEVTDADGLAAALRAEVQLVAGREVAQGLPDDPPLQRALLAASMSALRTNLLPEHFVELGIGCESCHGGSRAHVQRPSVLPDFAPRSDFLRVRPPDGAGATERAAWINRACARCHQVLFSRYPFTWEGGLRRGASADGSHSVGGSHITSGEGRDFLLGGCAQRMACTACHDPHAEDKPAALARLASPAGNGICTGCHRQYQGETATRAHAHHDPRQAGGACLACHMPRKNMGLGSALTRYHRIGSPDDPARVEKDRPLECALCHADRTVAALVGDLERWWGRRYRRSALADLYGDDLNRNALVATVERGKAHEQATAMAVLGERGRGFGGSAATVAVARQVLNPYPLVRSYALRALQALSGGGGCAVDLNRSDVEIGAAVRACVPAAAVVGAPAGPRRPPADRARAGDEFDED